jgi:hypothetical protein
VLQEAEANKKLLTKEYLEYVRSNAIANLTKVYFGEKIPSMFHVSSSAILP